MDLMGCLGTLADDIMKAFRAQFNLSEPMKSQNRIPNWLRRWLTQKMVLHERSRSSRIFLNDQTNENLLFMASFVCSQGGNTDIFG
jgi:hypothetical protein